MSISYIYIYISISLTLSLHLILALEGGVVRDLGRVAVQLSGPGFVSRLWRSVSEYSVCRVLFSIHCGFCLAIAMQVIFEGLSSAAESVFGITA